MAIPLDEYKRINSQMPKPEGKGDEAELSEKDETALDKSWQQLAEEKSEKKQKRATV